MEVSLPVRYQGPPVGYPGESAIGGGHLLAHIFAIAATGYSEVSIYVRTGVWAGGCLMMALGSLINAMRCGRLQSYLLTPLFLLGALASLAYGTGIWPLGSAGWGLIGYGLLAGLCLVSPLPELFLGRYR